MIPSTHSSTATIIISLLTAHPVFGGLDDGGSAEQSHSLSDSVRCRHDSSPPDVSSVIPSLPCGREYLTVPPISQRSSLSTTRPRAGGTTTISSEITASKQASQPASQRDDTCGTRHPPTPSTALSRWAHTAGHLSFHSLHQA
ncbi:hypothetical protein IWX49DRAFT_340335 [Phyllosticta citricarpa]|uniref:Secreted protein n=1 Tax=Phyllosticta citricarpa TaxID=55181 RepID=A0ABR1MT26_9PEZI